MKFLRFFALLMVASMSASGLQAAAAPSAEEQMREARAARAKKYAEIQRQMAERQRAMAARAEESAAAGSAAPPVSSGLSTTLEAGFGGGGGSAGYKDEARVRPAVAAYEDVLVGDAATLRQAVAAKALADREEARAALAAQMQASHQGMRSIGIDKDATPDGIECCICMMGGSVDNPLLEHYDCKPFTHVDGSRGRHKLHTACFNGWKKSRGGIKCPLCEAPFSDKTKKAEAAERKGIEELFKAAEEGDIERVKEAIERGFDVNTLLEYSQEVDWTTAGWEYVREHGYTLPPEATTGDTSARLISAFSGAPRVIPEHADSLFISAVKGHRRWSRELNEYISNIPMIEMLLARGAKCDMAYILAPNSYESVNLFEVVMRINDPHLVELFLDHGAWDKAMYFFLWNGGYCHDKGWEILELFLQRGFKIDALWRAGGPKHTWVHKLAFSRDGECLRVFLSRFHPDINVPDSDGRTPLHYAVDHACRRREETGWIPDFTMRGKEMPSEIDTIKVLLEHPDFNVDSLGESKNRELATIAHIAAALGDIELFRLVVNKFFIDPRIPLENGNTLLHTVAATEVGMWDVWPERIRAMVNHLVNECHLDVNAVNNDGKRPIDLVDVEHLQIRDQLLGLGSEPSEEERAYSGSAALFGEDAE